MVNSTTIFSSLRTAIGTYRKTVLMLSRILIQSPYFGMLKAKHLPAHSGMCM